MLLLIARCRAAHAAAAGSIHIPTIQIQIRSDETYINNINNTKNKNGVGRIHLLQQLHLKHIEHHHQS